MFNKDIKVLKNYDAENDAMLLYEECFSVSLFLEKNTGFMDKIYKNCSIEQEEDLDVEILELRDFIAEMFYVMTSKKAIITFPNTNHFHKLYLKNTKPTKLINKFLKTLRKVNKANEKNAIKVGISYDI